MVMPRMPRVGGGVRVPRVRAPMPRTSLGTGLGTGTTGVGRLGDKSKKTDEKKDEKKDEKGRMGDKRKAPVARKKR